VVQVIDLDSSVSKRLIPRAIRQSLRYRLLAFLLISLLILMSVTMMVGQRTANHEFAEILDGQMITTGRAVFSIIVLSLRQGDVSTIPLLLDEFVRNRQGLGDWLGENDDIEVYDNEFYFQLDDANGKTVFASQQPALVNQDQASPGLFTVDTSDGQWHFFSLRDAETGYTFYTGQSQKLRHELSSEAIEYILLPFVLVTLVILGSIWAGTRYGLKPLIELTQELHSRSPEKLDIIETDDKATELRPLITALNTLFARVSTSLAIERQFSANASHELRTPLAGITANLDAVRCLSSVPEQAQYLSNIESCVNNATQVTEGLLLLSRLQSTDRNVYFTTAVFNVIQMIEVELAKRVAVNPGWKSRIRWVGESRKACFFMNAPQKLLEIAVGNILDNALKYSTDAVEIAVCADNSEGIVISVSDHGPGIPEDRRDQVFQRFYRANTDRSTGFGLGLALVEQIMRVLNGRIQLSDRLPKGLTATLTLPSAELQSGTDI